MGTKKKAEKSKKLWIKVLAVVAGIFFAAVMVLSAMGSSWITSFAVIKPGDVAVVDYTLRDAQGTPIMTSNQQLYTQAASQGSGPVLQATDDHGKPVPCHRGIPCTVLYLVNRLVDPEPVRPVFH